ncbi:MAG: metal ABC transporter ATP-binding protein [Deltaproteobacteria bacterium]|nr:metal ABC transporter ATP-binding protein [Deltaproteobacteria bacterium]
MDSEILNVKNLSVTLNGEEILKDLSFNVKRGEVLVILGPNAAGKTTLFKTILGLLPYSGQVEWNTKRISYIPPQELLHRKDLPPLILEDFFRFKKVNYGQISQALNLVGLGPSILKKAFAALSTGEFQRMLIAWGLVDHPEVLLLDEPAYGIDLGGQETIYSLLHVFWKEHNLTILLITHDLNIVWEQANSVLCLNKSYFCYGKPQEVITPQQLERLYGTGIEFYKHSHIGN